jgi:hypothetical protein
MTIVWRRGDRRAAARVYMHMAGRAALLVMCLFGCVTGAQEQRPLPDAKQFLLEVRKHLETDEQRQSGYMYVETRREQKLDKAGRPTSETVKVFESYPGLPGEPRWERVISEDGKPVPPNQLEKTDAERRKRVEAYARKLAQETPADRARRARARDKEERERNEMVDDALNVFDIRMVRREPIEGHDTILFSVVPKADAKSRTRAGNIARNFSGRAWISEADHEIVRVELEAIDNVSIGFGLLARLHKGSQMAFQRRKVNGEVWLPAAARYSVSARVGVLAVMRRGAVLEFSDYRKFGVDTKTTIALPKK